MAAKGTGLVTVLPREKSAATLPNTAGFYRHSGVLL